MGVIGSMTGSMTGRMRLVSWNVNSLRARVGRVLDWLDRHQPDVALLQETKGTDGHLDAIGFPAAVAARGYELAHHGRDHWNGVAVLSRVGLDRVQRGFPGINRPPFDEARTIAATCGGIRCWSVYAPNGRTLTDPHYLFKLVWFERLRAAAAADLGLAHGAVPGADAGPDAAAPPSLVLAGDLNVAPADADIYDPVRWRRLTHASRQERAAVAALVDLGLADVTRLHHPGPGLYTWWSYRPGQLERNRGLRIDLALASAPVAHRVAGVWIDTAERAAPGASDHAPLVLDLT